MIRTCREVAARAVINAALGFRAQYETNPDPKSRVFCQGLLPWLGRINLVEDLFSGHFEILAAHCGRLSPEMKREAKLRGEASELLGWMINVCDKPAAKSSCNPSETFSKLNVLSPDADEFIENAVYRSHEEIEEYCAFCIAVAHYQRLTNTETAMQAAADSLYLSEVGMLGLGSYLKPGSKIDIQAKILATTAPETKELYAVRALTAQWVLGEYVDDSGMLKL